MLSRIPMLNILISQRKKRKYIRSVLKSEQGIYVVLMPSNPDGFMLSER